MLNSPALHFSTAAIISAYLALLNETILSHQLIVAIFLVRLRRQFVIFIQASEKPPMWSVPFQLLITATVPSIIGYALTLFNATWIPWIIPGLSLAALLLLSYVMLNDLLGEEWGMTKFFLIVEMAQVGFMRPLANLICALVVFWVYAFPPLQCRVFGNNKYLQRAAYGFHKQPSVEEMIALQPVSIRGRSKKRLSDYEAHALGNAWFLAAALELDEVIFREERLIKALEIVRRGFMSHGGSAIGLDMHTRRAVKQAPDFANPLVLNKARLSILESLDFDLIGRLQGTADFGDRKDEPRLVVEILDKDVVVDTDHPFGV